MKKMQSALLMILGALILASCGGPTKTPAEISEALEPGEKPENAIVKDVDLGRSTVAWEGYKPIGGGHDGSINIKGGELYIIDDQLVGGIVVIDMTTIVVLDIEDPESNARLKGHLEHDDFFNVAEYPESTFEMANIVKKENAAPNEPNYDVSGNLTIRGITNGITIPAHIRIEEGNLRATAEFSFDRSRWNVRFGSGSFFDNLGDNLISDNINLTLDIIAK